MGRRSRSRSRSYRSEDEYEGDDRNGTRLHIADISPDCNKRDLEREFEKFGEMYELWLARTPPCFGFAVYRKRVDAYEAMDALNGKVIGNSRLKITLALPRARERSNRRTGFDSSLRCYQCGERGHFARDCERVGRNRSRFSPDSRRSGGRYRRDDDYDDGGSRRRRRRSRNRSRSRSRNRSRSRSRNRSRSRSRDKKRGRSESSRDRREKRRGEDSRSPPSRKNSRSASHEKIDESSSKRKNDSTDRDKSKSHDDGDGGGNGAEDENNGGCEDGSGEKVAGENEMNVHVGAKSASP